MDLKKLWLSGLLFSLPFFLIACSPTAPNPDEGNNVETSTAVAAPAEGQKINENLYTYYYGQSCIHCKNVEDYLKKSWVDLWITIVPKEVSLAQNQANRDDLFADFEKIGEPTTSIATPTVVITAPDGGKSSLIGEDKVLAHFKELEQEIRNLTVQTDT